MAARFEQRSARANSTRLEASKKPGDRSCPRRAVEQGVALVRRCRSKESHLCSADAGARSRTCAAPPPKKEAPQAKPSRPLLSWQSSSYSSFGQRIYRCHRLRLPFSGTLQRQEYLIQIRVYLREQAGKAPVCLPEGKPTIYLLCALKRLRT